MTTPSSITVKETISRQYTIAVSQFRITVGDKIYDVELYNESVLASKIADYFKQPSAQQDAELFLRAMSFALDDEDKQDDEEELPSLTKIMDLMIKIDPAYGSLSITEFVDNFALNGQIKRHL
jgi:hypothetical protein